MRLVKKQYYESSDGIVKGTYREVSEYEGRRKVDGFEVKRLYCTNRCIDNVYFDCSYKYNYVYDNETRYKTDELFIEYIENDGKYAIVSNDKVITEWVDNIGIYSIQYHPCYVDIGFGVYVHRGNEFGILYGGKGKRMLDSLREIEYVGDMDDVRGMLEMMIIGNVREYFWWMMSAYGEDCKINPNRYEKNGNKYRLKDEKDDIIYDKIYSNKDGGFD